MIDFGEEFFLFLVGEPTTFQGTLYPRQDFDFSTATELVRLMVLRWGIILYNLLMISLQTSIPV